MDLDLGNYERFLDIKLTRDNNITTGKIYQVCCQKSEIFPYEIICSCNEIHEWEMLSVRICFNFCFQSVLDKERKGDYLGKTVQVCRSSRIQSTFSSTFSYTLTNCHLFRLSLTLQMPFKSGLNVWLLYQWMERIVQLTFVS